MKVKSSKKEPPKTRNVYVRFNPDAFKEINAFLDAEQKRTGVRPSLNSFIVRHTLAAARNKQIDLL